MSLLSTTKTITQFRPQIRSRHKTHDILRGALERMPFRSIIRFGSTTPTEACYKTPLSAAALAKVVEINTTEAVANSSSKIRMKQRFSEGGVITAEWYMMIIGDSNHVRDMQNGGTRISIDTLHYPIIAKVTNGSRGEGMKKLDTAADLRAFLGRRTSDTSHILERFYNYGREFRLHVTKNGCFYTCRKALKRGTPAEDKWHMSESNCVWFRDTNPNFNRPSNWTEIEAACVAALKAVGLDVAAIDVKVQLENNNSGRTRQGGPSFIVLETNSAPGFGDITGEKYMEMLPTLLKQKASEPRSMV